MKHNYKKFGILLVIIAVLLMAAGPSFAHAADPNGNSANSTKPADTVNFFSCVLASGDVAACSLYKVGIAVDWIIGLFVSLGGFLVRLGLQFNDHIFDSPFIKTGFSVSLAIANLGFVLGIIIIALATILRNQTYGIKQLLWKLVAMAILVNFGLVIAAPIVGLADSMTQYFNTVISGSGNDGYEGLVTKIGGAFQPQAIHGTQLSGSTIAAVGCSLALLATPTPGTTALCIKLSQLLSDNRGPEVIFSQTLLAVIFGIILSSLVAITLLSLAVLLLVRYVALGILLVLLPLAWLTWIFPSFKSNFTKWWSEFVKWTFFPALMLFFIYLALITATRGTDYANKATEIPTGAANGPEAAAGLQVANVDLLTQAANEVLLVVLMMGGIFAASSLAGTAGSTVVNGAKATTGWVAGYVGKQTKKGARLAYQKAGGEKLTQRLREGRIGILGHIPGLRRGASLAGAGLGSIATNEKMVEEAKKGVPKDPEAIWSELAGSRNRQDQFARIARLVETSEFGEKDKEGRDRMINGKTVRQFLNENLAEDSDAAKRFGQQKLGKDADKAVLSNKPMREAEGELANLRKAGKDTTAAMEKLNKATQEFVEKLGKADMSKGNVNEVFGKETDGSKALARALAIYAPHLVSSAMPKMKAPTLAFFSKMYPEQIKNELKKSTDGLNVLDIMKNTKNPKLRPKEIDKLSLRDDSNELKLWRALEAIERIIGNNIYHPERDLPGGGWVAGGAATPSTGGGGGTT